MFKKILAIALLAGLAACSQPSNKPASTIAGAGATFPAPVYLKWAEGYKGASKVSVNYNSVGSGAGVKQLLAKTVDFGASDKPMKPEDLDKNGLYQFPTVMGGVVPVINVTGIAPGQLKLNGAVLGDIFLGKITKWNDPALVALNPGVNLPATAITVVHRSDGSGTSFLFTTYLASQNAEWSSKVGASDAVNWPLGLGGKGNDGVAAFVKQTEGSIGYVEYAYAKKNGTAFVLLQNKAGQFPAPGADSFAAAAASADWANAPGNYVLLLDQPGEQAWPITGATFILVYKDQKAAAKGTAVLQYFDWAYQNGDAAAAELDYVPMPASVKTMVRQQWSQVTSEGKPVYTSTNK
ncbi:phosphate ABC transporter, phosphate-binding protein PstS [Asticcacaulis biprosthecium C19]|uniref:Phosphate-binding protein PstS n=1 Tax=Asticcacaulis biprosthecium C19 TaxID=715226 RepID=F4QMY8_9CAUL|nr:phosphate ABC transporter substrate-binding protein PstS [Asticcacaulis biprosthecium]EGF91579.1 phosphate ABC transporter, phosphate-binding protein PstS [Asticcacaulis biprosthecium C19]